jgi:two-component system, sensor histidine kinase PdtaS
MRTLLTSVHGWPLWLRAALAVAALGVAYFIQIPLEREVPGEPFLLFYLLVVGATIAFGQSVGFLAAALSALLSVFFFEPGNSLRILHAADLVQIELYAVLAGATVFGVHRLRLGLERLYAANRLLAESEKQKDVLLNELAHRVANNFATIAALIQQKSATVADPSAKTALNEATEQVRVMARIHSRLQVGAEKAALDSRKFMLDLCQDLRASLGSPAPIAIECTAVSCPLTLVEAVPIGLIVNELVTNAVKYAFRDGRKGSIHVILEPAGGELRLSVRDNGGGMQGAAQGTGLGHRLLRALAAQLGGRLEIESGSKGTTVSLLFGASPPQPRAERPHSVSLH